MPLTIPQKKIAEIVTIAAKVNAGKTAIPILECIKICFGADGISIEATDMDKWITLATPGFNPKGCDIAIIPCRQLLSIITGIEKEQNIEISTTEKRLMIRAGGAKYQFGLMPESDWPVFKWEEKTKPINLVSGAFAHALQFTLPSVAIDSARYYLQGIHISAMEKNKLRMAASDGHQLSYRTLDLSGSVQIPKPGVLLPRDLCLVYGELMNLCGGDTDVALEVTESKARLEFTGNYEVSLTGRLIDAAFPDIDRIIPYEAKTEKVSLPRKVTIAAMQRLALIASSEKFSPIKMNFLGDFLKITSKNTSTKGNQLDEGEEIISLKGEKFEGTINISLEKMHSLFNAFDGDKVVMHVKGAYEKGENTAIILSSDKQKITPQSSRFALLMPLID